jgi:putative redox protein
MARVELTWIEGQRYLGVDSTRHSVVLSSGDDVGVRPSEALLIALAACSAHDVVAIVEKQRAELRRLSVTVSGEQETAPPRAFRAIHLRFAAAADGLTPEKLRRAADLALNKYCSVRASLSPTIAVTFETVLEGSES